MATIDTGSLDRAFATLKAAGPAATRAAAEEWADELLAESLPLVPIEEGPLSASGRTAVSGSGSTVEAAVGYGSGPSSAYAVAQHERLDYQHDNGRQAHYLRQPLERSGAQIAKDALTRAFGKLLR